MTSTRRLNILISLKHILSRRDLNEKERNWGKAQKAPRLALSKLRQAFEFEKAVNFIFGAFYKTRMSVDLALMDECLVDQLEFVLESDVCDDKAHAEHDEFAADEEV